MAKDNAAKQASKEGKRRGHRDLKKINDEIKRIKFSTSKTVHLLFEDEVGFGRINKPKYCWCEKSVRPSVPCHHIREYRYAFGAVEPLNGDSCFLVLPFCDTICMNVFLQELSKKYAEDEVLLCCDSAAWHKSKTLVIPANIHLFHIPPYTPEMNPIEQIWKELRKMGFRNEVFSTLNKVVERLCYTIRALSSDAIRHITAREWILNALDPGFRSLILCRDKESELKKHLLAERYCMIYNRAPLRIHIKHRKISRKWYNKTY